jgi:hypothetical protein
VVVDACLIEGVDHGFVLFDFGLLCHPDLLVPRRAIGGVLGVSRRSCLYRQQESVRRISDSVRRDTQMPSSVKANLLDDGVVDTLGSVGATSGVYISINASDSARIPSRSTSPSCPSRTLSTKRVMHDDGMDFSSTGAGYIGELQNFIERPDILWEGARLRCRKPTPRYDGRSPVEWRILVSRRLSRKDREWRMSSAASSMHFRDWYGLRGLMGTSTS